MYTDILTYIPLYIVTNICTDKGEISVQKLVYKRIYLHISLQIYVESTEIIYR